MTGGSVATLTRDPAGLPAALVAEHPELKGAVALRLDKKTAQQLPEILKGQVAVAMYDSTGTLLDATGAQTAIALDACMPRRPRPRSYGVSFTGRQGRLHACGRRPPSGHAADLAAPARPTSRSQRCAARAMTRAGRRLLVGVAAVLGRGTCATSTR